MVYFCYQVNDQKKVVNAYRLYIETFGVDVLYDTKYDTKAVSTDEDRINKFEVMFPRIKYAVIFYSENFADDNVCLYEYQKLVDSYKNGEIEIIPIFLGVDIDQVSDYFYLLRQLEHYFCTSYNEFLSITLSIISKIVQDEYDDLGFQIYSRISDVLTDLIKEKDTLEYKLLVICDNMMDFKMKLTAILCAYTYLIESQGFSINRMHYKTMSHLVYSYSLQNIKEPDIDGEKTLSLLKNIVLLEFFKNRQKRWKVEESETSSNIPGALSF